MELAWAHEHGHVRPRELVEGEHALLQDLPDLGVILLASSLLLGLARVAVVQAHPELAVFDALSGEGADTVLVGELLAVVGEHRAHPIERACPPAWRPSRRPAPS